MTPPLLTSAFAQTPLKLLTQFKSELEFFETSLNVEFLKFNGVFSGTNVEHSQLRFMIYDLNRGIYCVFGQDKLLDGRC